MIIKHVIFHFILFSVLFFQFKHSIILFIVCIFHFLGVELNTALSGTVFLNFQPKYDDGSILLVVELNTALNWTKFWIFHLNMMTSSWHVGVCQQSVWPPFLWRGMFSKSYNNKIISRLNINLREYIKYRKTKLYIIILFYYLKFYVNHNLIYHEIWRCIYHFPFKKAKEMWEAWTRKNVKKVMEM